MIALTWGLIVAIVLGAIYIFASENYKEFLKKLGWNNFIVRAYDFLKQKWPNELRWGRLRGFWWFWSILGLTTGVAIALWLSSLLIRPPHSEQLIAAQQENDQANPELGVLQSRISSKDVEIRNLTQRLAEAQSQTWKNKPSWTR